MECINTECNLWLPVLTNGSVTHGQVEFIFKEILGRSNHLTLGSLEEQIPLLLGLEMATPSYIFTRL